MKPQRWRYLLAVISGAALAASDWPLRLTVLHFFALVPLFVGYMAFESERVADWLTGLIFGATYGGLLALSAATVIPVWIAVICGVVQWTIVLRYVGNILRIDQRNASLEARNFDWLLRASTSAAVITLTELFIWHAIPVFGMAQCFARVTSATPMLVQFAAYTGLAGVVFVLVFLQVILANILAKARGVDQARQQKCAVLFGTLALLAAANYVRWQRPLGSTVRVAAFGWSGNHELTLEGICEQARAADAQILVTPELGFSVRKENPDASLKSFQNSIRSANLNAAIGVIRWDLYENQALLIDAMDLETYTKNHLIPFMENSRPGGGRRTGFDWSDVRCGVMICQDDNFSDHSRAYARENTQLMLVPTMDWDPICGLHFESSVMRAIENGYAICRGASGGISALISPRGEIIASHNHNTQRDAHCVAGALTVGDGQPTIYSRYGDWPIGLFSLGIIMLYLIKQRSP